MIRDRNANTPMAGQMPRILGLRKDAGKSYRLISWLIAGKAVSEVVATRLHLDASPEAVWNHIMFYEEVPGRPPLLLGALLPQPVRTEGDKTRVGAMIRCVYKGGDLVKRVTSVQAPHLLQFDVIEQNLGIEHCIVTRGGSYQLNFSGDGTDVSLITNYLAYLRPRFLWRPLEAFLVYQLHSHILSGVCAAVLPGNHAVRTAVAESLTP